MMMKLRAYFATLIVALAALAHAPNALAGPNDFMIVALPDTQYYSQNESGNTRFHQQTAWINSQQTALKIQHVCHLGDVCNHGWEDAQYSRAKGAMDTLKNSTISFGMAPGNHDYWSNKDASGNVTYYTNAVKYRANFGAAYYAGKPFYGGHSPTEMSMWTTFTGGGRTFISLSMDVNAPDSEIAWAQGVLNANPGVPVIMSTHEYLNLSGRDTGLSLPISGRNTGQNMWDELVKNNDQIFMVLCGHVSGQNQQRSFNSSNHEVLEILSDYQSMSNNGNGFLRSMTFDPDTGKVSVQTYSPTLGRTLQQQDADELPSSTHGLDGSLNTPVPEDDEIGAFTFYIDLDKRFAGGDPVKRYTWNSNASGNWSDRAQWGIVGTPDPGPGSGLTALTFSGTGTYTATNDLGRTLPVAINELNFDNTAGTATLAGAATIDLVGGVGTLATPKITETGAGGAVISARTRLSADTTVTIANELTFTNDIRGSKRFTKNGAGTVILSGSSARFISTGGLTVNAGSIRLGSSSDCVGSSLPVILNAGATIDDSYFSTNGEAFGEVSGTGTLLGRDGLNLSLGDGNRTSIFGGRITAGTSGVIGTTTDQRQLLLKKLGTGTITLTGTSDFAGQVQVLRGYLPVSQFIARGQASPLGLGDMNNWGDSIGAAAGANAGADISLGDPASATAPTDPGTLRYTGASATTDRVIAAGGLGGTIEITSAATNLKLSSPIGGASVLNKTGPGILTLLAAPNMTGSITIASGSVLEMDTAAAELTLTSAINGPGIFNKRGTGTLIVGTGGDFGSSLVLNVAEGTIRKGSTAVLGDPNILNIAAGATWDNSYGGAERFGGITGSGTYFGRDGSGLNLYVNIADVTFAGKITAGLNGVVGATASDRELGYFFKTGSFKLTLTSTTSDFRNTVTAQQGVLSFNNWAMRGTPSALGVGFSTTSTAADAAIGTSSLLGTLQYTGPTVVTDRRVRLDHPTGDNTLEVTNAATSLTVGVISGVGKLAKTGAGTLILPTANTHVGTKVAAGTINANHVQALGAGGLEMTGGAVNTAAGFTTPVKLTSLSVTGGTFNIQNNKVIVANGNAAALGAAVAAGRIVDSDLSAVTTIAFVSNADLGKSTFGGVNVLPTDILAMTALTGDANLSGGIDADDYFAIDSNYGKPSAAGNFARGDFDYSGGIDGDDYFHIDSAFLSQQGGGISAGVSTVPEPMALVPAAAILFAARRRPRRA